MVNKVVCHSSPRNNSKKKLKFKRNKILRYQLQYGEAGRLGVTKVVLALFIVFLGVPSSRWKTP